VLYIDDVSYSAILFQCSWLKCSWTADNSISLIFYSQAVALRITSFNVQKFYMVLMLRFMCCVWMSEQIANFVVCHINRLVLYNRGGESLQCSMPSVLTLNRHVSSLKG
jgi:hypothetical protein